MLKRVIHNVGISKAPEHTTHMRILKYFAKWFAIPLAEIFNKSFKTRIFPRILKNHTVCGVTETAPCTLAEDLRPISLTSILTKLQGSFAVKWMYEDIEKSVIPNMGYYQDHQQSMPLLI